MLWNGVTMIGNYYILMFSMLFILFGVLYFSVKSPEIDVVDVYIIFVLFHFGFYPFVRGLHFGKDIIFDFTHGDPLSIGLVFAHVLIILVVLKLLSVIIIKNIIYLKVNYLVESYSRVNNYVLCVIYSILIIFQFFSYYKYGVQSFIPAWEFEKIGKLLPYWFTSFRTIYNVVTFCVCLVLLSKLFMAKEREKDILWLVLTIIFVPFASIYGGKRFLLSILILSVIFYSAHKHEKIFAWRNIKYGLVLLMMFVLFSNLFESYRNILTHVGEVTAEEVKGLKSPLSAAMNFESTIEYLGRRPGTWEFSYLVLNKQIREGIGSTKGEIFVESFKSAVPRYFWKTKNFLLIDDMLAKIYGVRPKEIDIGKNNYGIMQLEVGYLSVVLVPLMILILLVLMGYLNKITTQYPLFSWIFSSNILYYLINIEDNGNDVFFMIRNIIFVWMLYLLYLLTLKIKKLLINDKL
jgi:hypothetical protein